MIPRPNVAEHRKGDGDYLRELIEGANVAQAEVAAAVGVDERTMRRYCAAGAPYAVQFAIECYCAAIASDAPTARTVRNETLPRLYRARAQLAAELERVAPPSIAHARFSERLTVIERELIRRSHNGD